MAALECSAPRNVRLILPGTKSKRFPFFPSYRRLLKNAQQQTASDILRVRIWNPKLSSAPIHVLVIAAGYRSVET